VSSGARPARVRALESDKGSSPIDFGVKASADVVRTQRALALIGTAIGGDRGSVISSF
jgi:hypothetical protein